MSRVLKGIRQPLTASRYIKKKSKMKILNTYYNTINTQEKSIWDDWELAIVLDACRPDVLQECSKDFSFLPDEVLAHRSNASYTKAWMENNFKLGYKNEMKNTAYITSSPYSDMVDTSLFNSVDEVWKYAWSTKLGTQPPRPITDQAIKFGRSSSKDRLLVHYLQPHFPSIPVDLGSKLDIEKWGKGGGSNIFERLEKGNLTHQEVWGAYRENCRYVLEDVQILLENYDADNVVITSDHANAFGEFGFYGHPQNCPIPAVRNIPWVETSAEDQKTHVPDNHTGENIEQNTKSLLEDLGYLT